MAKSDVPDTIKIPARTTASTAPGVMAGADVVSTPDRPADAKPARQRGGPSYIKTLRDLDEVVEDLDPADACRALEFVLAEYKRKAGDRHTLPVTGGGS